MNDRDYERFERRRRTRRKSALASIAAVAVILVAVAAIVIAIVAVISRNQAQGGPSETVAATEQPTLYQPSAQETSAPQPTTGYSPTESGYQPATQSYYSEPDVTEAPYNEPYTPEPTYAEGAASASDGALHYYAHGKTSYGYDWTYSGGGGIVSVTCKYNFDLEQYDFIITGLSEGVSDLTLIYNTGDGQTSSHYMTVTVDSNLNVYGY